MPGLFKQPRATTSTRGISTTRPNITSSFLLLHQILISEIEITGK